MHAAICLGPIIKKFVHVHKNGENKGTLKLEDKF